LPFATEIIIDLSAYHKSKGAIFGDRNYRNSFALAVLRETKGQIQVDDKNQTEEQNASIGKSKSIQADDILSPSKRQLNSAFRD